MTTKHQPDPVRQARETPELRRALEQACAQRGLSAVGARLVHRYSNAVYLLPAEPAIARITPGSGERAEVVHAVTEWLADVAGVAATAPLRDAHPVVVDPPATVSFWVYYPQPDRAELPTSVHLARILKRLHAIDVPPVELGMWQPLTSLSAALDDPIVAANLESLDRNWLRTRVADVQAQIGALDWPLGWGLIHGDAWAGNLLWRRTAGPDSAVLGDWDGVSRGPREIDLIPTWHAATRYGHGQQWATDFADIYGYDLATWDGFSVLLAMRDLVQITGPLRRAGDRPEFRAALRQRLDGIQSGDKQTVWRAL